MLLPRLRETTERLSPFVGKAATADAQLYRLRRLAFLRRVQLAARLSGATLDAEISLHARIGRRIRVSLAPGSTNVLRIGDWTTIDDEVTILLKGGTVLIGQWCDLRRGVVLNVAGRLELVGSNVVSWGSVIHCAESVSVGRMTGLSEGVTIADSTHYHTTPDAHFYHNIRPARVEIGSNVWLAPHVTVTRGARIGDGSIVGANSLVVGKVAAGVLVSGVPARVVPRAG